MISRKQPRVQAQRKFAQGAPISSQQSSPLVHSTPTPAQPTHPKISTKVPASCKDLLDVISLKNNNHKGPLVIGDNLHVVLENMKIPQSTQTVKVEPSLKIKTSLSPAPSLHIKPSPPPSPSVSMKQSPTTSTSSAASPPRTPTRERLKRTSLTPVQETPVRKLRSRPSRDSEASSRSREWSPSRMKIPVVRGRSSSFTDPEENRPLRFLSKDRMVNVPEVDDLLVERPGPSFKDSPYRPAAAGRQLRESSISTTASSVPLAFLKAQRQGLRVSLRQMKKRNTPGFEKRGWGPNKKKPKKSQSTKKKPAKKGQATKTSPHTPKEKTPPRKRTEKQKETAAVAGSVAAKTSAAVLPSTSLATSHTDTGKLPSCSSVTNGGSTHTPLNEPGPSSSAFKVPCGVAKRSVCPPSKPPGQEEEEEHDYCGNCERCHIISGVMSVKENFASPHQLINAFNNQDSGQPGHDIYDFRSEDGRIATPGPFRPRASSVADRLSSVSNVFGSSAPKTRKVIEFIDKSIRVFNAFNSSPDGQQAAELGEKYLSVLRGYKKRLYEIERAKNGQDLEFDGAATPVAGCSKLPPTEGEMLLDGPVFRPTEEQMLDLNSYLSTIEATAARYGICKIVPPESFKPPCHMKNVRFKTENQYISTLFNRWAPVVREMTAIKAHLATSNVTFKRPPLFGHIEVDLVKLFNLVQKYGGLIQVMRQHMWSTIAQDMKLTDRRISPDLKFDKIYIKYLLPYYTLSQEDREELHKKVQESWERRLARMKERARTPLRRVARLLEGADSSGEDEEPDPDLVTAFADTEDCIIAGQIMDFERFKMIGAQLREMFFQGNLNPDPKQVEDKYWNRVERGTEHVCVLTASLDTSQENIGFPKSSNDLYGSHPWNLKRLGEDPKNVLSYLGPTLAVTIPTLHLGMMFSTNCWHMDPHHLPWTDYMHEGPPKIWYGISADQSDKFRAAMEKLCPTAVQNKPIWLPSDVTMVPPPLLIQAGIRLSRVIQHPGEYVIVLPRAYSCSISTGITISESLYFASQDWLKRITGIFKMLRSSCEPSMISVEELLTGIVDDPRKKPLTLLQSLETALKPLIEDEMKYRRTLADMGIPRLSPKEFLESCRSTRITKASWQMKHDECNLCRYTLFWSKMINIQKIKRSVCLEHGISLLENREKTEETVAILFTSDKELNRIMTSLNRQLKEYKN